MLTGVEALHAGFGGVEDLLRQDRPRDPVAVLGEERHVVVGGQQRGEVGVRGRGHGFGPYVRSRHSTARRSSSGRYSRRSMRGSTARPSAGTVAAATSTAATIAATAMVTTDGQGAYARIPPNARYPVPASRPSPAASGMPRPSGISAWNSWPSGPG